MVDGPMAFTELWSTARPRWLMAQWLLLSCGQQRDPMVDGPMAFTELWSTARPRWLMAQWLLLSCGQQRDPDG